MLLLVLGVALATEARAAWEDLKAGHDARAAFTAAGAPLVVSKSRSGTHAMWTYDGGGYIQFERGRVTFWQAPKLKKG